MGLQQEVTNLVENTLKHGLPGGAVWVSVTSDQLSVRDPGQGQRDEWPGLLQPFERRGGIVRRRSSLGLGFVAALSVRWGTLQPGWSSQGSAFHLKWAARTDGPAFNPTSKESSP